MFHNIKQINSVNNVQQLGVSSAGTLQMASRVHLGGLRQTEQHYSHQHISAQMLTAQLGWQNVTKLLF